MKNKKNTEYACRRKGSIKDKIDPNKLVIALKLV